MLSDLPGEEFDEISRLISQVEGKQITKTTAAIQLYEKRYKVTLIAGIINSSIPSVSSMLRVYRANQNVREALSKER